jgi:hypothetical protein
MDRSHYLGLVLIFALLIFTAFTWYLQSSVSTVLLTVTAATLLTTAEQRFARWVMILAFVVYQLVFLLLPLVLLTLLIASRIYQLAVGFDPVIGYIPLMNDISLLLFGSVIVREISIMVLWRVVRTQVDVGCCDRMTEVNEHAAFVEAVAGDLSQPSV